MNYSVDWDGPGERDRDEEDCDHEEYELDILTGRATCGMCGHRWFMTPEELKRDERLRSQPYPKNGCQKCAGSGFVDGKDYEDGSASTSRPCPACTDFIPSN